MRRARVHMARGVGHKGTNRVRRGGSWNNDAQDVRAAYRNRNDPSDRNSNIGFRLSRAHRRRGFAVDDPASILSGAFGLWQKSNGPRCVSNLAEHGDSSPAVRLFAARWP